MTDAIKKRLEKGIPAKDLEKIFGKAAVDKAVRLSKPKKKSK